MTDWWRARFDRIANEHSDAMTASRTRFEDAVRAVASESKPQRIDPIPGAHPYAEAPDDEPPSSWLV